MKPGDRSKLFCFLVALAAVLVFLRLILPFWVRDYVNQKLSELKDFRGHVEDVDLALWRGAYKIREVKVVKTSGNVPVPFFSAPLVDLSVEWKALFHGAFVGEINFVRPQLNFVNGPSEADTPVGLEEPWTQKIKQLFPLKINRFTVDDGEVHYRDFHKSPKVDVVFDRFRIVATNLTNGERLSKSLHAHIAMEGHASAMSSLRLTYGTRSSPKPLRLSFPVRLKPSCQTDLKP